LNLYSKQVDEIPSTSTLARLETPVEIFIFPFSQNKKKQRFPGKYFERGDFFDLFHFITVQK
jgi:hypothetical protein